MSKNPQLYFIAGPNGAGKSTFSGALSGPDAIIFDVDKVVARLETRTPKMSKKQIYDEATQEFFNQATGAVRLKSDFTLETNFRDEALVDIAMQFKGFGYDTNLIYLTLPNIKQSVRRVDQRVKAGGHYVDLKNITQNFELGLDHLEKFAGKFDRLEILETADENLETKTLLIVHYQTIKFINEDLPESLTETINRIADQFRPGSDLDLDLSPNRPLRR